MSDQDPSALDLIAQQGAFEKVRTRYNSIFILLSLNRDNEQVKSSLNSFFSYLAYSWGDFSLINGITEDLHAILVDEFISKDPSYFSEKIPASNEYILAVQNYNTERDRVNQLDTSD